MDPESNDLKKVMTERFAALPKVVQDAINSASVEEHLRELARTHKLHIDQWQLLENNVMMTLMGFQPVAELSQNLQKDLETTPEIAGELAKNISAVVFAPIRSEMERALDNPTAVAASVSAIDAVRSQEMQSAAADTPAQQTPAAAAPAAVQPATPPAPAPEGKAVRAQISGAYSGSASHERKTIEGDPYREQLS